MLDTPNPTPPRRVDVHDVECQLIVCEGLMHALGIVAGRAPVIDVGGPAGHALHTLIDVLAKEIAALRAVTDAAIASKAEGDAE